MRKLLKEFKNSSLVSKIIIICSIVLFWIAITQNAFYIEDKKDGIVSYKGIWVFLFGWMNLNVGEIVTFSVWLANPLFIATVILLVQRNKKALWFNLVAFVFALLFFTVSFVVANEAGGKKQIVSLGFGYKIWLTSIGILLLASVVNFLRNNK